MAPTAPHDHPHADPLICRVADEILAELADFRRRYPEPTTSDEEDRFAHAAGRRAVLILEELLGGAP